MVLPFRTEDWKMLYRVIFADGSVDLLDADNLADAKTDATEEYPDSPVKRVVVVEDQDEDDEDDNPPEGEDDNPPDDEDEEDSDDEGGE
jgi:hypothetical protein